MTSIRDVELGVLAEFGWETEEGRNRGLYHNDYGIDIPSHTKGGRATEVRMTWERI